METLPLSQLSDETIEKIRTAKRLRRAAERAEQAAASKTQSKRKSRRARAERSAPVSSDDDPYLASLPGYLVDDITSAPSGGGNDALFVASARAANYFAGNPGTCPYDDDEMRELLVTAYIERPNGSDNTERKGEPTFWSGWNTGIENPIVSPHNHGGQTSEEGLAPAGSEKPEIIVGTSRHLNEIVEEMVTHIIDVNDPPRLFRHGDVVTQYRYEALRPLNHVGLLDVISHSLNPMRPSREGLVPGRFEPRSIDLSMERLLIGLPEIRTLVRSPFWRRGGTVCNEIGYDDETCNYLVRTLDIDVPEKPSYRAVLNAVKLIDEFIVDFPLATPSDRAHVFALLLTPLTRHLYPLAPLFALDGNAAGVGKGLLGECSFFIVTGDFISTNPLPINPEEQRKAITSTLAAGRSVALYDEAHLITGTSLARLLTSTIWSDRLLGHSKEVSFPNALTLIAAGNNIEVRGDLPRRTILIRLETQEARPELREKFLHDDLRGWVTENRAELLSALLTILVGWHRAGAVESSARLGSFDDWAKLVGGALEHAGVDGFLANIKAMRARAASDEADNYDHLAGAWHKFGRHSASFSCRDVARAFDNGEIETLPSHLGRSEGSDSLTSALGYAYRRLSGRWISGPEGGDGPSFRLVSEESRLHGRRRWMIEKRRS